MHLFFPPPHIFSYTPHFFLHHFFRLIPEICTPIPVREAHYFIFQIYPCPSNFCILTFHLMIIYLLHFKIISTIKFKYFIFSNSLLYAIYCLLIYTLYFIIDNENQYHVYIYGYKVNFLRSKKTRQNLRIGHIMYMILLYKFIGCVTMLLLLVQKI